MYSEPGKSQVFHPEWAMHEGRSSAGQSIAFLVLAGAARLLPLRASLLLGRLIGRFAYTVAPWRLATLRNNIAQCSVPSGAAFERSVYEHLGCALMLSLTPNQPPLPVTFDAGQAASFREDSRCGGVVLCTAHIGVWEQLPAVLSPLLPELARQRTVLVYRPLHHAWINRWMRRRRSAAAGGVRLLADRHGCMNELSAALEAGGLVGLLADQRPGAGRGAVPARFLGRPCEFSPGTAALHRRTGAPVWFAALLRDDVVCDGAGRVAASEPTPALRLHLRRLAAREEVPGVASASTAARSCHGGGLSAEAEGESEAARERAMLSAQMLTQAYADALTDVVNSAPAAYFWFHDRWRKPK